MHKESKRNWHSLPLSEVMNLLKTDENGLQRAEVKRRLSIYGHNTLPSDTPVSLLKIILHQILNPLIFILLIAAVASIIIGEADDSIFIFLVIIINTTLGAYQEYNAEKSAKALKSILKIKALVKRDGVRQEVDAEDLVPGDVVFLESGMKVPADIRLITTSGLTVDESALTGESIPNVKDAKNTNKTEIILEASYVVFAATSILTGRGTGLVVNTGAQTEVGTIATHVSFAESAKPPLIIRMEKLVKQISIALIFVCIALGIIMRLQGFDNVSILFYLIALAVSAIPEGLPIAITVALSVATKKMAKRNVIVKHLHSVESLGSCTVIASDKTGTLTMNEQTARKIVLTNGNTYDISGEGYNGIGMILNVDNLTITKQNDDSALQQLVWAAMMANEGTLRLDDKEWVYTGDTMDVALLAMAYKAGYDPEIINRQVSVQCLVPYESHTKFSACMYAHQNQKWVVAKGALETILSFCEASLIHSNMINTAELLSAEGYRVLAFASDDWTDIHNPELNDQTLKNLQLLGLVAFIDPLRPEAKSSVDMCKEAGIKVHMITGDHPHTAKTISVQLGIISEDEDVISGANLNEYLQRHREMGDSTTLSPVYARVSPSQKLDIVSAIIDRGQYVAVTGDGINDAPALKRANIGVAMGSGTNVAREACDMIIVDDRFSSIIAGIEEGRIAFDNVRKVIYLLISTGFAEVILFIFSILIGLPLPLLAVQLLWLNLVTNGIQDVALAFEKGEPNIMKRHPRKPDETIFNKQMIRQIVLSGSTMAILTFSMWAWLIKGVKMAEIDARNLTLLLMVFLQNFHVLNCRSETISLFKIPLKNNYLLLAGVLIAQGIHIISMHVPFMQKLLKVEPITVTQWCYVLIMSLPIVIVLELFKKFTLQK